MHSMPNFAVLKGESRHESSAKQQQAAMFVSDILEKLALSPRYFSGARGPFLVGPGNHTEPGMFYVCRVYYIRSKKLHPPIILINDRFWILVRNVPSGLHGSEKSHTKN